MKNVEEFIKKRFPHEQDEGYKNEWRKRFASGDPEVYMDSKSKEIFKSMKDSDARRRRISRAGFLGLNINRGIRW